MTSLIGLAGLQTFSGASPAAAAVFDAAAYPLKFNSANRVAISPAGNVGTNVGDVVRYNGVATISGTVIDAVIRVVANTGAVITQLDNGGAVAASPPGSPQSVGDLLQTDLTTTAAQSVTLDIDFYEGGTYTGTGSGVPVTLANVKLGTYDIDAGGAANRQYVDFRGFQTYLTYTGSPNSVAISNQTDGFVRFEAPTATAATATSGSYSWARAQVNYDRTTGMQVRLGVLGNGGGFFALDFSAGGIWTTDGTTQVTPTPGSNPNNRPPTTSDVSLLRATVNATTVLTAADFPYTDLDDNAMASVRVVTVPSATDATLEYFNGTSWQAVTAGFVITTADLDLGKLRITPLTPSGSFTFQVNDGLAYSAAATLSYTSPPNGQTITFPNPGTKSPSTTFPANATASSGLATTLTTSTPSVCSIAANGTDIIAAALPSGVSTAICVVTAAQEGNATYGRAEAVTQQFSISALLPQAITFADPADREFSTTPIVSGAVATPSGLPVTLGSLTPAVCTVSGGSIVPVTPGICSVRATQAGNGTYAAASPVTQTFTLTTVAQTITFAAPADQLINGGPLVVAPTASSGLPTTLTSSTPAVCTVTGYSIAFVSVGECTVTATQPGNGTYDAATPVTHSFDIDKVSQTITFAAPADQPANGGPVVVTPTASSGLTPTLTSSTPLVCTVTGFSIALVGTGECTVTATQTGNATYDAAPPVTHSFDVGAVSQTITFAAPADQLINGGPLVVAPTASSGLTTSLASSTPAVCSVTGYSIAFLSAGECTVTATQPGNGTYEAATPVTHSFDISLVSQSITFAAPADQFINGGPLVVAPTASSGLTTGLTSSTPAVCSVAGYSIAFISTGECTVTATQPGNGTYEAATPVTHSFDINLVPQSIIFAQPADQVMDGGPLVVAPTASSGLTPILSSSTPTVCTVSGMSITFIAVGECTVTASQPGDSTYGSVSVTRSFQIDAVDQTITFAQPTDQVITGGPLVVAPTASSGLTPVLTSSTPAICSVTGFSIAFLAVGECTVTADQAGDATYSAATPVTRSFDIVKASQTITFAAPADQDADGGPLVVAPTASSGLTPVLTSTTPAICSVTGFSIAFLAVGECTVTATQAGDSTFEAATPVTHSFDITSVDQTITFAQPADQVITDGPLVVAPTASSGLTPTLTSTTPAVCSVTGFSIALLAVGECTVTAAQAGDATYGAATPVTRSFDVTPAPQNITFAQPADQAITAGTLVVAPTASSGLTPVLSSSTTAVCTVSGLTITLVSVGECTVTASQPGDGTYSAATPVTRSFDVSLFAQVITFAQPSDVDIAAPAGALTVSTDAPGLTPVLTSNTPAICTVSGQTVSYVGTGVCSITATQSGNGSYSAATPVTRTFRVLEITTASLHSMVAGKASSQPIAVAGAGGGGVWSTSAPLPGGLTIDPATGVLGGTPTVTFHGPVTFIYTENGVVHEKTLVLDIVAAAVAAGALAHAGTDSLIPAGIAVLLLMLGAGFAILARRRKALN